MTQTIRQHNRPSRRSRGYVLLLTLLILALAASVMAEVCRSSLNRSLAAGRAEEELQRRWAVLSCQAALLPRVEQVLARAEAARGAPVTVARVSLVLGSQRIDVVLADEQAKLNVNELLRTRGKSAAERAIREVVRGSGSGVKTRLLAGENRQPVRDPLDGGVTNNPDDRPLHSFGQVFPDAPAAALIGHPATAGRTSPTIDLTCWGDGALHFRRASPMAVRQFCSQSMDSLQIDKLLEARNRSPDADAFELLDDLQLSDAARDVLDAGLEVESNCHSLWIIARSPQRSWYHLAVLDKSVQGPAQTVQFAW